MSAGAARGSMSQVVNEKDMKPLNPKPYNLVVSILFSIIPKYNPNLTLILPQWVLNETRPSQGSRTPGVGLVYIGQD